MVFVVDNFAEELLVGCFEHADPRTAKCQRGGAVVERRTCDREVAGSIPGPAPLLVREYYRIFRQSWNRFSTKRFIYQCVQERV